MVPQTSEIEFIYDTSDMYLLRAVFDGGKGFPPQEVADPPESSAEPLCGSTLTPP